MQSCSRNQVKSTNRISVEITMKRKAVMCFVGDEVTASMSTSTGMK